MLFKTFHRTRKSNPEFLLESEKTRIAKATRRKKTNINPDFKLYC